MTEIGFVVPLVFGKPQKRRVGTGELGKAEEVRSPSFAHVIDAGDTQPYMAVFFYQEKVVIVVTAMKEKAVVGQEPETPGSFEMSERWIFLAEGECGFCSGIRLSCSAACIGLALSSGLPVV